MASLVGWGAVRIGGNAVSQTTVVMGPLGQASATALFGSSGYGFVQWASPAQQRADIAGESTFSVDGNTLRQETAILRGITGHLGATILDDSSLLSAPLPKPPIEQHSQPPPPAKRPRRQSRPVLRRRPEQLPVAGPPLARP